MEKAVSAGYGTGKSGLLKPKYNVLNNLIDSDYPHVV